MPKTVYIIYIYGNRNNVVVEIGVREKRLPQKQANEQTDKQNKSATTTKDKKEREQNKEKAYRNNVVVDYCGYVLGIYIYIYIYIIAYMIDFMIVYKIDTA